MIKIQRSSCYWIGNIQYLLAMFFDLCVDGNDGNGGGGVFVFVFDLLLFRICYIVQLSSQAIVQSWVNE